jgi:hypothetical protein
MRPPGLAVYGARELGREVVVLEGDDPAGLGRTFGRLMDGLRSVLGADGEPMINVAGTFGDGRWRLIVFPRSRHRPAAFFSEGEDRIVVSPGVVEMGGTLITPVERDFERLDGPSVEAIYREVSIDGRVIGKAVGLMG